MCFLLFAQNFFAFRMKVKSQENGPGKHALGHIFGVQKTVPRNGPLLIVTLARELPGNDFWSQFWVPYFVFLGPISWPREFSHFVAPSVARSSSWGTSGFPGCEFLLGCSSRGGFASIRWNTSSICQHDKTGLNMSRCV